MIVDVVRLGFNQNNTMEDFTLCERLHGMLCAITTRCGNPTGEDRARDVQCAHIATAFGEGVHLVARSETGTLPVFRAQREKASVENFRC